MPVSVITDVITWIEMVTQIGLAGVELGVLNYLVFGGGWLDMIRLISFWLDTQIIKYVDKFYTYFDKILSGNIFAPDVVDRVMNGVYVFVSVFVLFKLIMLFMKYITNPEMVTDDKVGAHSLVKRVIIGMVIMLLLPTIFTTAMDFQKAIISDNVFGKIFLDKGQLRAYEKNKNQMGRILAFNVYQGFWNIDDNKLEGTKIAREYKNAGLTYDPGVISNINAQYDGDYAIDYFPIMSTIVLCYVLYLVIKYCIDVVVRTFKLFILQMLGPLAISDYMINGDSKDMFKSWIKTTISAYAMLFMRIFSIWFIAFITILMNNECTTVENGICKDSMLYIIEGQNPDYLLKGIITLALLAFLMDLPKMLSELFGLDLEQDASVKGLMQKVGGVGKMLGMGAMAAGGAAIGGAIGAAKNTASVAKNTGMANAQNKAKLNEKIGAADPEYAKKMKDINDNKQMSSFQKSKAMNQAQKEWLSQHDGKAKNNSEIQQQASQTATKDMKTMKNSNNTTTSKKSNSANTQNTSKMGSSSKINSSDLSFVDDYKRNKSAITRSAATQMASGVSDFSGGVMKAFASQIPGLREGVNSYSQSTGQSLAQQNINGRPVGMPGVQYSDDSTPAEEILDIPEERDTVAGVPVSNPDPLSGERTTDSGIILNSNVEIDKKN